MSSRNVLRGVRPPSCLLDTTLQDAVVSAANEPTIDGPQPAPARRPRRRRPRRRAAPRRVRLRRRAPAARRRPRRRRRRVGVRDAAPPVPRRRAHVVRRAVGRGSAPALLRDHGNRQDPVERGADHVGGVRPRGRHAARADRGGGARMSTTTGPPPNVAEYLDALRAELADLAPEERDDLLSEVEPSLLEAAADDDEPIAARLGPAADFAADLRASAGLPPAPRSAPPRTGLRAALRELAGHPAVIRAASVLRELAPIWWVARAYVAVAV